MGEGRGPWGNSPGKVHQPDGGGSGPGEESAAPAGHARECETEGRRPDEGQGSLFPPFLENVIRNCLEHGLTEPEFKDTGTSIVVIFRKSILTEEMMGKLGLNERQEKAIKYVEKEGEITNRDYRRINDIGKVLTAKELGDLVEKKVFERIGKGRATKDILKQTK